MLEGDFLEYPIIDKRVILKGNLMKKMDGRGLALLRMLMNFRTPLNVEIFSSQEKLGF